MSEPNFASLGPTLLARKGGAKPAMRPQLPPLVQDEAELAALADEQLEDLGWNDMGADDPAGAENGADVVPINAAVAADAAAASASPIVRRQQRRLEERVLADAAMTGPEGSIGDEEDDDDDIDDSAYAVDYGDEADEYEEEYEDEDDDVGSTYDHDEHAPSSLAAPMTTSVAAATAGSSSGAADLSEPKPQRRAAFTLRLDSDRHLKLRLAATMQGVSAQALVTEALDALLSEFDDLDVIAAHLKRH